MPVHDGRGGAQSRLVGGALHVEPLAGVDLVGTDDGAYVIVEDFGRRAGQGAETGRLQSGEEFANC